MTITADMIMPRLGETLDDIAGALQYVDYFFPNYDEACLMTGEKMKQKWQINCSLTESKT